MGTYQGFYEALMQAYTPAFDFNPLETDMTYEQILEILKDPQRTDYQRAADIHAALAKATQPSALTIKAATPRKKREPRAPKPNGHLDLTPHEEATP